MDQIDIRSGVSADADKAMVEELAADRFAVVGIAVHIGADMDDAGERTGATKCDNSNGN